ncbi:sulfatase-like hydrolase/transferase [Bradyrhizobium sp. NP1]|uniref:sulfatase-like hydrolase/transferase n=1 Tax=Bradyrhizobium sp. NP1 TaxID=3049772 RepID=UPI0025A5DD93|nr:sulfatase-like hydrolase/transferase [Bradyrhizobium sp. NP1]WJR76911.1 sulfatase-like hydrolase/transferase [Bradyrhizobium sp. NP1]
MKITALMRITSAATLLALMGSATAFAQQSNKPNVVFILADNVGYGDLGSYGGGELRGAPTPRIDALAQEGLRLTQFLVESACTPSRAALMTGQYSIRNGLSLIAIEGSPYTLPASAFTMGELFKSVGYATAIFGKWHLGSAPQSLPTAHGFDEFYGIPPDISWDASTYPQTIALTHSIFNEKNLRAANAVLGRRHLVAGGESASSNDSPLRFEATTLGDRVVVMKDGAVQQVGEPLELYNQPANRFVPGFIGSPAMNFARVTVDEANGSLFAGNSGLRIKAFNGHEKRYLIVACTVITDVPEAVGPCPTALMAKVSLPLYLAFALYS